MRRARTHRSELSLQMDPHKAEDQGSSWESEREGEKAEELAILEALDDEAECSWPKIGTESQGRESEIKGQHSTTLQKTTKKSRCLKDSFGPTQRRRSAVDVNESHRSSAARNAEEHVSPKDPQRKRTDPKMGRVQGTRRRAHQELLTAGHVRQNS